MNELMEKKSLPIITIVTAVFNRVYEIEDTIKSVINQTYPYFEYIIIDGGSTDGTVEIIKMYSERITWWVSERDNGVYDAMNKGIDKAQGDWINFMNAGDSFPNSEVLYNIFNNNILDNIGVIYGDTLIKTKVGSFYSKCKSPFFLTEKYPLCKGICHQSVFVRLALAKKNKFNIKYKIAADFDMLFQIFSQGYDFYYIECAVSEYNIETGLSKINQIQAWKEDAEITQIENTIKFKIWLLFSSLKHFTRKSISRIMQILLPSLQRSIRIRKYSKLH